MDVETFVICVLLCCSGITTIIAVMAVCETQDVKFKNAALLMEKANREAYIRELEQRCGERDPEHDEIMANREELYAGMDAEVAKVNSWISGDQ